ncbi:MAG: hypothetical protein ACLQAH_05130 [Limisphaerales bacterium]
MKVFKTIIFFLPLAILCFFGTGCDTLGQTVIDNAGPKNESQYDQMIRERQDRWQLQDAGGGY